MSKIINIDDHMAYICDCGSVHYNLLRSGKIECANCQKVKNSWYTDDENELLIDAIRHVAVDKQVLFSLMYSHSRLAQAEYHRNPSYNDTHYSHMAETALASELSANIVDEYFNYVDAQERTQGGAG